MPNLTRWMMVISMALLLIASIVTVTASAKLYRPIDDTYITMVYARSIAEGRGFTFGSDTHPTLGTTTPLNALLLAGLYTLFPFADKAGLAIGLSAAAWIATGWLWFFQGHVFGLNRIESFFIAILTLVESTVWVSHLGMETRLFTLLLTVCLLFYFKERFFLTGILISCLFLTRGEGILLVAPIALHQLWLAWKSPDAAHIRSLVARGGKLAAGALVIVLPWFIYAYSQFGTVLPDTLAAKSIQIQIGFTSPFIVYMGYLFVGEWSNLGFISGILSPWAILLLCGTAYAYYHRRRMLMLLSWCILFLIGYFLLNVPTYKWYALPVMYVIVIFAGLALAALATLIPVWFARYSSAKTAHRGGVVAAFASLGLICLAIVPQSINAPIPPDQRHDVYYNMSEWLNTHTPENSSVAYVETGVLAWYSHNRIIDLLGLTNPELIPALRQGGLEAAFQLSQPDYLICATGFLWECQDITSSPDFASHYTLTATLIAKDLGGFQLPDVVYTIYRRG